MGHCHRRFSRLRMFSMERRYRRRPPLPRSTRRSLLCEWNVTLPAALLFLSHLPFSWPVQMPPTQRAPAWQRRPAPARRLTGATLRGDPPCIPMAGAALSHPIPGGNDTPTYSAQPRPSAASQRPAPALPPRVSPSREVETPRRPVRVHCTSADDGGRADPLTSVDQRRASVDLRTKGRTKLASMN
jgi:hypothetical protein